MAGDLLIANARGWEWGRKEINGLWTTYKERLKLDFPERARYHCLKGNYPVNIISTTHHARRLMRGKADVICKTNTSAVDFVNLEG